MSGEKLDAIGIKEILAALPHRYPFLLVDRIIDIRGDEHGIGIKNVTINGPFFPGHFPEFPVMPGVLIIEALAQAAAILSFKTLGTLPDEKSVYYFVGIDDARFKRPVSPGDQLTLDVVIERNVRGMWKFGAQARVGDALAAAAVENVGLEPLLPGHRLDDRLGAGHLAVGAVGQLHAHDQVSLVFVGDEG